MASCVVGWLMSIWNVLIQGVQQHPYIDAAIEHVATLFFEGERGGAADTAGVCFQALLFQWSAPSEANADVLGY